MRIAINCRSCLKRQSTGIGRYTFNLIKSLSEIDASNEYQLYVPRRLFDFKRNVPVPPAKNFTTRIDYFKRGPEKTLKPCDMYHAPSPEILPDLRARIVVTIHDLIYKTFPQSQTPQTRAMTEEQMALIVSRAQRIICCSQSTLKDLTGYFSLPPERAAVVYQGVDGNVFFPMNDREKHAFEGFLTSKGVTGPYLLFVGTIEPRKNLKNLLRAFARLKAGNTFRGKLLVAGMTGWMSDDIGGEISSLGLKEDVIFLGYVSDEILRGLYNCAQVFVFPSYYEGFGFPLLEALNCGAAVVTSNVSSCPEIVRDAALTVDPDNPEDIARAVERILEDGSLREHLRQKGLARAGDFSFRKTAEQTLSVYQEIMGQRPEDNQCHEPTG